MASSTVSVVAFLLACAVMGATSFQHKIPEDHKCAALNEDMERVKVCFPEEFADCDGTDEGKRKAYEAYKAMTQEEQEEMHSCIKRVSGCADENDDFDSESCVASINEDLPEDVKEAVADDIRECDGEETEKAKFMCVKDAYDEACGFPKHEGRRGESKAQAA